MSKPVRLARHHLQLQLNQMTYGRKVIIDKMSVAQRASAAWGEAVSPGRSFAPVVTSTSIS
jgi:hypothetical protein